MSAYNPKELPVCYTVPHVDNGSRNAPQYSLERTYSKLLQRPDLEVIYNPARTDSLLTSIGVAEEKAASIQAIASTLYLSMRGEREVSPDLIERTLLTIGALASDAVEEIGQAQERIKEDIKEALGEKIE